MDLSSTHLTNTPLVSVIVVNYNGPHLLGRCLDSLRNQTYPSVELIVVDNLSVDGSVDFLRETYPEVRVIVQKHNLGFAGGCNVGIAVSRGDLVATLNNDAEADPQWL